MIEKTFELPRKQRAKQVAQRYGISLATVWRYVKEGKIKAYKLSPRVSVFDTEELEEFFSGGNYEQ